MDEGDASQGGLDPSWVGAGEWWVAERFWPGVDEHSAVAAFDALRAGCTRLSEEVRVRFVGGTVYVDDEVVASRFEGSRPAVIAAHELAGCTFDRLSRAIEVGG